VCASVCDILYTCGDDSIATSSQQMAGNCVSYVLSPSTASRRFYVVVSVIYIFIVHVGVSEQVFYASSGKSSSSCEACTELL
jgi:hypothetical protein